MKVLYQLEPYDIQELKARNIRKSSVGAQRRKLSSIIEEFIDSGYDCCRVGVCDTAENAHICGSNIGRSIRLHNYYNVKVVLRGKELYLVRKNKWEEK